MNFTQALLVFAMALAAITLIRGRRHEQVFILVAVGAIALVVGIGLVLALTS